MIDHHMNPQEALDAARFLILDGTQNSEIVFEKGISSETIAQLSRIVKVAQVHWIEMGHKVHLQPYTGIMERNMFGNGQIIRRDASTGVLCAGSDCRADGMAIGWCAK